MLFSRSITGDRRPQSFHPHSKVETSSVAEAAAIIADSDCHTPLATSRLIVPKQIFRLIDHPGAVTIAIAQAEQEYTDPVIPMT